MTARKKAEQAFRQRLTAVAKIIGILGIVLSLAGIVLYRSLVPDLVIPGTNFLTELNGRVQILEGRRQINGVYIGKKGMLFQDPVKPDSVRTAITETAMSDFASKYTSVRSYVAIVPDAAAVQENLLPGNAPVRSQQTDIDFFTGSLSGITNIDIANTLKSNNEKYIYYRTDPHWTTLGAEAAFEKIAEEMSLDNVATDFTIHTVSKSFSGTLAETSGIDSSRDALNLYEQSNSDMSYVLTYADTGSKSATFYSSEGLNSDYPYNVFLGGDHSMIDIKTSNQNGRILLLVCDSYGNCLLPFLAPYFERIYMVNPDYYYNDIDELVTTGSTTDILYCYGADSILTDSALARVLNG
ncbi:MAG: DHHW family protein [Eubacterium sp.]|nr:DHHW family protein [Eubacterium sp.]